MGVPHCVVNHLDEKIQMQQPLFINDSCYKRPFYKKIEKP